MSTTTFVNGNRRVTVRDGAIIGHVGPAPLLSDVTEANGWTTQTDGIVNEGRLPSNHAQQRYQSMRAQGISENDARFITGYQGA